MATDDDRCVRLRIRQRKWAAFVSEHRDGRGPFPLVWHAPVPLAGALVRGPLSGHVVAVSRAAC